MRHLIRSLPPAVSAPAMFVLLALLAALAPTPVAAQDSNFALSGTPPPSPAAAWTFTPSILYQGSRDDNVLLRTRGDQAPGDFLNLVNPKATLNFTGRRSQVDLSYDGAFLFYQQLGDLNSFEQHASLNARRAISRRVTLFVTDTAAAVPTTELVQFIAVPFIRTGSELNDLRSGLDVMLTKHTSMKVGYDFEWVSFQHDTPFARHLRGGHSHGGTFELRHGISPKTTVLADYHVSHAIIANNDTFDVQDADLGVAYQVTDATRVYAAGGVARVAVSDFGPARNGPAVRAGISRLNHRVAVDVTYSRSFVPAFAFGGTYQNEEIAGFVRVPISQRLYTHSSVAWRRNESLGGEFVNLTSLWTEAILGFAVQRWVRLEVFYSGSHQSAADIPGGVQGRNRIGFQIVAVKPLRVR